MKYPAGLMLLILWLSLSMCRQGNTWHQTTAMYFDTVCEIQLYCSGPQFQVARDRIDLEFARVSQLFSPGSRFESEREVRALFAQAWEIHQVSQGCFDITVEPLSRLWGFRTDEYRVPSVQERLAALTRVGMEKIRILPERLDVPENMELDWGGIAKGYGLDRASQALRDLGVARGFINAGGDLFCWGMNPSGRPWQIGVKEPRGSGYLGVLSLSGAGAATTGDYQRFFMQDGIRYHHVFDPRTGLPARGRQSVTVLGPETSVCDALSTALFVSDSPEEILVNYPEYGAFLVDREGNLTAAGKSYPLRPWQQNKP